MSDTPPIVEVESTTQDLSGNVAQLTEDLSGNVAQSTEDISGQTLPSQEEEAVEEPPDVFGFSAAVLIGGAILALVASYLKIRDAPSFMEHPHNQGNYL
jgi:hypothetical protein